MSSQSPQATGLKVEIRQACTGTIVPEYRHGYWEESYVNTLERITICDEYPDVVTTLPVRAGETVYLVWAEWSAGDSYGIAIKRFYETFGVFYDMESAQQLEAALQQRKLPRVRTADNQHFKLAVPRPWGGFFDRFENLYIQALTIS